MSSEYVTIWKIILPDGEMKELVAFWVSTLQQDYIFGNEEIQNLVCKYANTVKLSPASHMHNQISADQENLSEAKTGILVYLRKRLLTAEYNKFKFLVPEKMRIGTLETFSTIVT